MILWTLFQMVLFDLLPRDSMCLKGSPVNGCLVGAGGLMEGWNPVDMVGVVMGQLNLIQVEGDRNGNLEWRAK